MRHGWRIACSVLGMALALAGCSTFRSYDAELYRTLDTAAAGNVEAAIRLLESSNPLPDKDLLYFMELGMLQRLGGRYEQSQKAWMSASARLDALRAGGLADVVGLVRGASSYLLNDKFRVYEGHDYERVMLLTYIALNHVAMGDYDAARVAIKQTHELEAQIAELRAKQFAEVEGAARSRGARTSVRDLKGYPVETIDSPEVNTLRNSYQSALSHYLAGFIYEALGEPSLAAPGYRQAIELQPGDALLEEALAGLEDRLRARDDGMTDVLLVIGSGTAPALQSRQFLLPVAVDNRLILIANAFPVMIATSPVSRPARIDVEGRALPVARIASVDLMARRRLKDDLPSIMLRATIRSTAGAVLQYQAQRAADKEHTLALALAASALTVGTAVLASADDRTWRALPSEIAIARARLPRGSHTITLATPEGVRSARVDVSGRYAVIDFRLLRQQVFVNAPPGRSP